MTADERISLVLEIWHSLDQRAAHDPEELRRAQLWGPGPLQWACETPPEANIAEGSTNVFVDVLCPKCILRGVATITNERQAFQAGDQTWTFHKPPLWVTLNTDELKIAAIRFASEQVMRAAR